MKANELRLIRKRLGWSQARLAEAAGVAKNSIARQERGELGIKESLARLIRIIAEGVPSLGPSHTPGGGRKTAGQRKDSRESAASVRSHRPRPRKGSL